MGYDRLRTNVTIDHPAPLWEQWYSFDSTGDVLRFDCKTNAEHLLDKLITEHLFSEYDIEQLTSHLADLFEEWMDIECSYEDDADERKEFAYTEWVHKQISKFINVVRDWTIGSVDPDIEDDDPDDFDFLDEEEGDDDDD